MKIRKIVSAAAAIAASAVLATPAGAYITEAASPSEYLTTGAEEWTLVLTPEVNSPFEGVKKIDLVVTLSGDADKYIEERDNGYYDDGEETAFVEFGGFIGIGAELEGTDNTNWYQFGYSSLNESDGGDQMLSVRSLGDNRYLFTGDFGDIKVHAPDRDVSISFKDWGNKSPNYSITVDEFYAYAADGTVAIYSDANGNLDFDGHEPFDAGSADPGEADEAPEETTAAETEAETTEAQAPASETEAETTAPSADEADENNDAPAETTAQTNAPSNQSGSSSSSQDFGSRDSTLIIIGIAAGAVIIAVIVILIMMMLKKK